MASAYEYADGGRIPDELVLLRSLDRYGVEAVFGRALSFQELRMMTLAESVLSAFKEREKSGNWVEWADSNPGKAGLLEDAAKFARKLNG